MRIHGMLLLSVWLIAAGLVALLKIQFQYRDEVLGVLAVAAGGMLIWERKYDLIVLSVSLLAGGLVALLSNNFSAGVQLLGLIALVGGILLLRRH